MQPKVSVVIPTYNNAALIGETLKGVSRQTFRDFEVIVVDDGSSDNTRDAVTTFDSAIRYIRQENQGPAAARNHGVSVARGEFIALCDHDDIWMPGHLETLLRACAEHPRAAMSFDNAEYFGPGIAAGSTHISTTLAKSIAGKPVSIRVLWQCWVASMSVVMIRKEAFEKLGGLHKDILGLDDLHFYLRLAARHEVWYADIIGCRKRLNDKNLLTRVGLTGLVHCLEDLQRFHPEVVRAIGPVKYRTRLARKYRKLAERYLNDSDPSTACLLLWKAYRLNCFNLPYLFRYLRVASQVAGDADVR